MSDVGVIDLNLGMSSEQAKELSDGLCNKQVGGGAAFLDGLVCRLAVADEKDFWGARP